MESKKEDLGNKASNMGINLLKFEAIGRSQHSRDRVVECFPQHIHFPLFLF